MVRYLVLYSKVVVLGRSCSTKLKGCSSSWVTVVVTVGEWVTVGTVSRTAASSLNSNGCGSSVVVVVEDSVVVEVVDDVVVG